MVDFEELEAEGAISRFTAAEKERKGLYLEFHAQAYKEDLDIAESLKSASHRWSVTAAYYAMLNLTKLYLAKRHNLSINDRSHVAARLALARVLEEKGTRKRALELLEQAEKEFESFTAPRRRESSLPSMLSAGQKKRERASYYSHPPPQRRREDLDSLFKGTVRPFISIMEKL